MPRSPSNPQVIEAYMGTAGCRPWLRRSSPSATCTAGTAKAMSCTAWPSMCTPARSSPCSGATAPARPRPCAPSWACCAKRKGSVRSRARELIRLKSDRIARLGIAYCPEERGIFASLNVRENLMLPPEVQGRRAVASTQIYALFPNLKERARSQGTKLSGGEQQMLAIARILRTGAKLLLLDEPTEGLAPVIVQQIGSTIRMLREQGFHHPAGGAELPLCRHGGRPPLRGRARPGHRHDPQRRARGEQGEAQDLSRRLGQEAKEE